MRRQRRRENILGNRPEQKGLWKKINRQNKKIFAVSKKDVLLRRKIIDQ